MQPCSIRHLRFPFQPVVAGLETTDQRREGVRLCNQADRNPAYAPCRRNQRELGPTVAHNLIEGEGEGDSSALMRRLVRG
jgi:hypothetical protein